MTKQRSSKDNLTVVLGGIHSSEDSLVVKCILILRLSNSGKNNVNRKSKNL